MAVVPKKRKKHPVYYAVNEWLGKQVAEPCGTDRRQAVIRDRAMKREIQAGSYVPLAMRKAASTLRQFAALWESKRTNVGADDESGLLRRHIYCAERAWLADLPLDAVKPEAHIDELIAQLRKTPKKFGNGAFISDKTIANVIGVLSLIFDAAVRAELCIRNPVVLIPRTLKRRPAEEEVPYSIGEAVVLMRHDIIPEWLRVLNALCLLTAMRQGEAAALRFRDLETTCGPLDCIHVRVQWEGRPLKTEAPRRVPIHPELHAILEQWATVGFELLMGRKPEPDDYIVPKVGKRSKQPNHTRSTFYKAFCHYALLAGVPLELPGGLATRNQHSCRHTFISMIEGAGGTRKLFEKFTHNAKREIIDRYSHPFWQPLCEQMLLVNLDARPDLQRHTGTSGNGGGWLKARLVDKSAAVPPVALLVPSSIPGASTTIQHKTSLPTKTRQENCQESEQTQADFPGPNGPAVPSGYQAGLAAEAWAATLPALIGRAAAARVLARSFECAVHVGQAGAPPQPGAALATATATAGTGDPPTPNGDRRVG